VREVDLSGNETTPTTPVPPGYTIAAAVDGGLVVRVTGPPGAAGSLLVWDPTANRTVREIAPSGQVVAAQGPMVAWTGPGAPGLHLTDLRTGEDRLVGAPPDFEFGPRGVFSPDGQRLAVSLGAGTGVAWTGARRHDVGIVDVASTSLFRFDNPATGALAFAWLPSSEWLYLVNGDAFRAYRPGDPGSKPVGTSPAGITGLLAFGPGQDTPPPAPPPPWPPAPAALPYPAPSPPPARPATPDDVHRLGGFVDSDVDGGGRLYSHAAQIDALVAWCSAHGGKLGNLNEATGSGGSGTGYCLPASPGDFANVDRPRILPGAVPIDTGPPR
jgi:hypothetical protein